MTEEQRMEALGAWLDKRCITWKEVSRQCGTKTYSNGRAVMARSTMPKDRRDHFIALGVPEELLPKERLPIKRPRKNIPKWPNPEAAISPEEVK